MTFVFVVCVAWVLLALCCWLVCFVGLFVLGFGFGFFFVTESVEIVEGRKEQEGKECQNCLRETT